MVRVPPLPAAEPPPRIHALEAGGVGAVEEFLVKVRAVEHVLVWGGAEVRVAVDALGGDVHVAYQEDVRAGWEWGWDWTWGLEATGFREHVRVKAEFVVVTGSAGLTGKWGAVGECGAVRPVDVDEVEMGRVGCAGDGM